MVRVILVDDHRLFTDLVGAFLAAHGVDVVGVATTEAETTALLRTRSADVCLIDPTTLVEGPASAVALVRRLSRYAPQVRLVVLTGSPAEPTAAEVLAAGAAGHLAKSVGGEDLLTALEQVARGEQVVLDDAEPGTPPDDEALEARRRVDSLRARERECLELIVAGASTAEMAATMGVTVATVRSHVRAVLAALGVHSRLAAVSLVLRHDLGVRRPARAG